MFGPMKEALRGRRFSSDEEVTGATKNFFLTEIKKHVKHWNRCVEVEGDYAEK
jgi:hypothetical protein